MTQQEQQTRRPENDPQDLLAWPDTWVWRASPEERHLREDRIRLAERPWWLLMHGLALSRVMQL